jgi:hypothetical protein
LSGFCRAFFSGILHGALRTGETGNRGLFASADPSAATVLSGPPVPES